MLEFFSLFLHRVLSGAQNGLGYAKKPVLRLGVSLLLTSIPLYLSVFVWREGWDTLRLWQLIALTLCLLGSTIGALGVEDSFSPRVNILTTDIHLWEMLITTPPVLAWVLLDGDMIAIACSIYPSLVLHKGAVNIGGGHPFGYAGTDDPTGQTFSIPTFARLADKVEWPWLKKLLMRMALVPRASSRTRFRLAVLSICLFVAAQIFNFNFRISDIL